jgi:hypothetical protein
VASPVNLEKVKGTEMNDENNNVPATILSGFSGDDGFALVATPAGPNFRAPYMWFVKGTYELGAEREPVPPGTQFKTLAAQEGWVRLARGEPVRKVPREPGKPFPQRPELGDTDQSQWPLFDGQPSDPWTLSNELLLTEKETGRPVIFATTSWTGREAVADLCRLITYQRRTRGANASPIISIGVGTYRSRRGPVATPKFTIVDWGGGDSSEPVTAASLPQSALTNDLTAQLEKRSAISPTAQSTDAPAHSQREKSTAPSWDSDDLDDDIPF